MELGPCCTGRRVPFGRKFTAPPREAAGATPRLPRASDGRGVGAARCGECDSMLDRDLRRRRGARGPEQSESLLQREVAGSHNSWWCAIACWR